MHTQNVKYTRSEMIAIVPSDRRDWWDDNGNDLALHGGAKTPEIRHILGTV